MLKIKKSVAMNKNNLERWADDVPEIMFSTKGTGTQVGPSSNNAEISLIIIFLEQGSVTSNNKIEKIKN